MNRLTIKRTIKFTISILMYYSGLLRLYSFLGKRFGKRTNWKILAYHNVIDDHEIGRADTQPGMCVLTDSFRKQMEIIARKYEVISVETLGEFLKNGQEIPARSVAITFDDGWRDNYTNAYPILKEFSIPAMIFLATHLIKTDIVPAFLEVSVLLAKENIWPAKALDIFHSAVKKHDLAAKIPALDENRFQYMTKSPFHFMKTLMLLDYGFIREIADAMLVEARIDKNEWQNQRWMMTIDEIREMSGAGIEFGSHGESHDLMINISLDQVKAELGNSKAIIEEILGKPVKVFSYPNGDFNEAIKHEVRKAGYHCAMAMGCAESKNNFDIYSLRRTGLNEGAYLGPRGKFSKAIFACLVEGVF